MEEVTVDGVFGAVSRCLGAEHFQVQTQLKGLVITVHAAVDGDGVVNADQVPAFDDEVVNLVGQSTTKVGPCPVPVYFLLEEGGRET